MRVIRLTASLLVCPVMLSAVILTGCDEDKGVNAEPTPAHQWRMSDTTELEEAGICGLKNVSGAGKDFVFAVGCERQIAQRLPGGWTIGCCGLNLGTHWFRDISVHSRSYAVVVGEAGWGARYDGGKWSYSGDGWDGDLVWVIGYREYMVVQKPGSINFGYDVNYYNVATLPGVTINDIWGTRESAALRWIVVGDGGKIYYAKGSEDWEPMDSGVTAGLHGVFGADDRVFAVGEAGTVIMFDGSRWVEQASGVDVTLRGVWAASARDVFAVGDAGTIIHYDGVRWTRHRTPVGSDLYGVWGSSPDDVIAVGDGPVILEYGP